MEVVELEQTLENALRKFPGDQTPDSRRLCTAADCENSLSGVSPPLSEASRRFLTQLWLRETEQLSRG